MLSVYECVPVQIRMDRQISTDRLGLQHKCVQGSSKTTSIHITSPLEFLERLETFKNNDRVELKFSRYVRGQKDNIYTNYNGESITFKI